MLEGHVVLGAPGELGAQARVHALLNVRLGGDVADFLLRGLQGLHARVQLVELQHAQLVEVANVAHSLELVQVLSVVHEVKHEVVLHGDVKSLHLLGLGASLGDGALNGVLSLHEGVVLGLDLVNDTWGVNVVSVGIPVDVLALRISLALVVVVEDTRKLTMGVTGSFGGGSGTKSLHPVGSQVLVGSGGLVVALDHGLAELGSHLGHRFSLILKL